MTSLSTHVLDTEAGTAAAGVPVTLYRGSDDRLAHAVTDSDGRVPELASLDTGTYRLVFDVAAYLHGQGREAPFIQRVSIDFRVTRADRHLHVPLLITPYACTSYRGT